MPVHQETNARFLVQVSIKSQNKRKSKRKLLWAEKSAKWRSRYIYIYAYIHIYIYTHTDTHISMILALVSEFTWCFPCFFHVFPAFIRHFSILLVGGKWFLFPLRSHPHGFRISVARCLRRPWDEGISTTFWLKPINVVIPLLTMYIYIYTHIFIYTHDICTYIYNINI